MVVPAPSPSSTLSLITVVLCFSEYILEPAVVHFRKRKARFSDVWCGQYHTFAKDRDTNEVYAWGLNNYYQLGKWLRWTQNKSETRNVEILPDLCQIQNATGKWKHT